jgi:hypothetical protein
MFSLKCKDEFAQDEYIRYMQEDFYKSADVVSDRIRSGLPIKRDFRLRMCLSGLVLHVNNITYHPEFLTTIENEQVPS